MDDVRRFTIIIRAEIHGRDADVELDALQGEPITREDYKNLCEFLIHRVASDAIEDGVDFDAMCQQLINGARELTELEG